MTDGSFPEEISPERIWQLTNSFAPPLILEAAVTNGVFDTLEAGGKTLEEIASQTGSSRRGLRAILNALVGLELLARKGDRYELTEESRLYLVTSSPHYQGGFFRHLSQLILPTWLDLSESVRTGMPTRPVNLEEEGAAFFRAFVEDLFPRAYPAARALADELGVDDTSGPQRVLDLAAGSAVWSLALAERSPRVEVTVVDWPLVTPVSRDFAKRHGVLERFHFREGDLLEVDFGTGYDVATLGHILHSEGERRGRKVVKKTFDALVPGGTIAIAEMLPNEDRTGPLHALIFAVNMLVHTEEGDTFTFGEIRDWLEDAGFLDARTLEAPGPSPLILATKPR